MASFMGCPISNKKYRRTTPAFTLRTVQIIKPNGEKLYEVRFISADGYVCMPERDENRMHTPCWYKDVLDKHSWKVEDIRALKFEQARESKYAEALLRLGEQHGYKIETVIVFEAHEDTPDLLVCCDYIPREAWGAIHEANAVSNLDRESLEAKFGFALPTDRRWWGGGWYYKRTAIEILRSLGFIVKALLYKDSSAGDYTPSKEILPDEA